MKTTIYYFSGTGNSLHIARRIAEKLQDATLVDVRNLDGQNTAIDAERVGIVFPIYAFGPPAIMMRFLQNISDCRAKYVFAVCNCAGLQGNALQIVRDALFAKNIVLNSSFNVIMPSNYIPFGGAKPEKDTQKILDKAEKRIAKITAAIGIGKNTSPDNVWWFPGFLSSFIYKCFLSSLKQAPKKFKVGANCNGCGLCTRICPVRNITLVENKPQWGARCEACLGCLQWCPQEAIYFGRKTSKRHYHHPAVSSSELIGK